MDSETAMARLVAAAAAGSGVAARRLVAAGLLQPEAADAAGAAIAAVGAGAGAAGAAAPANKAAVAVGGPDASAADAASPGVGGPESAADAYGVPGLQQVLEQIDAGQGGPGPQVSQEAAAAQAALDEEILNEITNREQARLRRKQETADNATAANAAADAAEAASVEESNRLWPAEVAAAQAVAVVDAAAWADVVRAIPADVGAWPTLVAAKAAFNKSRRSGTPVERPGAAGSVVADAAPANPGPGDLSGVPPPRRGAREGRRGGSCRGGAWGGAGGAHRGH